MRLARYIPIGSLLSANILSLIGNEFSRVAIPWFVLMLTGSPLATAGILVVGNLPNLIAGLFSGIFIDRYSAKKVSLCCDAINLLAIALIPLCYSIDWLSLALLAVLVFASQIIDVPGETAKQVMVSELIDRDRLPRERINGLYSLTATIADLLGPVIAGVLLTVVGALSLLWIDACTFLLAALLIAIGIPASRYPTEASSLPIMQKWRRDLYWMLSDPLLRRVAIFDLLLNTVAVSLLSLALPVLAQQMDNATLWLGVWLSAFALGTTLTTVVYMLIGQRTREITILRVTPIGQVIGLVIVGLAANANSMIGVAIGLNIYGLNLGFGSMVDATLLQKSVAEDRRGNIFAVFSSLRYVGVPLGLLLTGSLLSNDSVNSFIGLLVLFAITLVGASGLWLGADLGKWTESR